MNLTSGQFFVLVVLVILALRYLKRVKESERWVVFRAGRFNRIAGPGMVLLIPGIERGFKIDLEQLNARIPEWQILPKEELEKRLTAWLEDLQR
jgi:regulator of protease activity HflC (stomatin/prohibitin superfamily)